MSFSSTARVLEALWPVKHAQISLGRLFRLTSPKQAASAVLNG